MGEEASGSTEALDIIFMYLSVAQVVFSPKIWRFATLKFPRSKMADFIVLGLLSLLESKIFT